MIRYIDLFAGIGGTRLGFENACKHLKIENECVLSCENNIRACETYNLNFREDPYGDVRALSDIPDFDFLIAGFPCQPFSYAGKMQGFGETRGTLFFEIERILIERRPKAFFLENVRGLVANDDGRTLKTIINSLTNLGYGVKYLLLNSSNYGVPQNRMRLYIVGILDSDPKLTLASDWGAPDSHKFKKSFYMQSLFEEIPKSKLVRDILEETPDKKYFCSDDFVRRLSWVVGNDFSKLNGVRLIDYRGGNSIHSWELGIKGDCTPKEISFMNSLITNRRKSIYGTHQDGKKLTLQQIETFYKDNDLIEIISSLIKKGYLGEDNGKFNPVCGNMSFEVFKFLDPDSISITLTSSDAGKLGIVQNNIPRRVTPRECARLQGFPDNFVVHPNDNYAYNQIGNSVSVPVVEEVMTDFISHNDQQIFNSRISRAV